jgi:hypothetical protein
VSRVTVRQIPISASRLFDEVESELTCRHQ